MPLRTEFPEKGDEYLGGTSDGKVYRTTFAGGNLALSYEMVRQFLEEEGYADVPLPKDSDELLKFKIKTRNRQILLFEDNGYRHNPVKILFPVDGRKKRTLILKIYNEKAPDHLLRFHNKLEEGKSETAVSFPEKSA